MADGGTGPVIREDDGGVATLWLSRGERNELDIGLLDTLAEALSDCEADPSVRAVVLTGAGSSFCAGIDLSPGPTAIRDLLLGEGGGRAGYQEPAGRVTLRVWQLSVPVIVAVNGDAVGGGATITLAADVRFAADTARFGFPFTRLGVCPEGASTWFLPRLVGPSRAADWLLSGRLVEATEGLAAGWCPGCCPRPMCSARRRTTPGSSSPGLRPRRSRRPGGCSRRAVGRIHAPPRPPKAVRSRSSRLRRIARKASRRSWSGGCPSSSPPD